MTHARALGQRLAADVRLVPMTVVLDASAVPADLRAQHELNERRVGTTQRRLVYGSQVEGIKSQPHGGHSIGWNRTSRSVPNDGRTPVPADQM